MSEPTYSFQPIEQWPGEQTKVWERSRFKASWSDTMDLLDRELFQLQAKNVILQAYVDRSQLRLDGMLRASARPSRPGVILTFDSRFGPLSYPCDRFDDWQDNVRAIALALEALRKVDRYGVTRRAEQYKGWAKLPDPSKDHGFSTAEEAWGFICWAAQMKDQPMDEFKAVWSAAVKQYHPDRNPDGDAIFKRLVAAREMIPAYYSRA